MKKDINRETASSEIKPCNSFNVGQLLTGLEVRYPFSFKVIIYTTDNSGTIYFPLRHFIKSQRIHKIVHGPNLCVTPTVDLDFLTCR